MARVSRLIIFGRDPETGGRMVWDILECACRPRLSEFKRLLTQFNPHNPILHLKRREEFRQMRAGELAFVIEPVERVLSSCRAPA